MRNIILKALTTVIIISLSFSATGCKTKTRVVKTKSSTTTVSKPLPPGQAKKITGEKSAKKYAPGQQKKKKNKN